MTAPKTLALLPLGVLLVGGLAPAQFLADLAPTSITRPLNIYPDGTNTLTSTIKNIGAWGSDTARSAYYLSTDSTISSSDVLLKTWWTPGLGILQSHSSSSSVTIPHNIRAGTMYFGVWTNRYEDVFELLTSNNTHSATTTAHGGPDLLANTFSATGNGLWGRGETVSVSASVKNIGGVTASAFRIDAYIRWMSGGNWVQRQLKNWNGINLGPGNTVSVADDVTIPEDAQYGSVRMGITVTPVGFNDLSYSNHSKEISGVGFLRGSFTSYGAGCAGSNGVPTLTASDPEGDPHIGSTSTFRLQNGPQNFFSVLLLGFSDSQLGELPLPLSLGAFGAPGCSLLTSSNVSGTVGTDVNGSGSVPIPIPNNVMFIGRELFAQFTCPDQGANALGWSVSNGLKTTLGSDR